MSAPCPTPRAPRVLASAVLLGLSLLAAGCDAFQPARRPPPSPLSWRSANSGGSSVVVRDAAGMVSSRLRVSSAGARFFDAEGVRSGRLRLAADGHEVLDRLGKRVCEARLDAPNQRSVVDCPGVGRMEARRSNQGLELLRDGRLVATGQREGSGDIAVTLGDGSRWKATVRDGEWRVAAADDPNHAAMILGWHLAPEPAFILALPWMLAQRGESPAWAGSGWLVGSTAWLASRLVRGAGSVASP